jgi:dicarboxylate/amino acid:cation (Na+ or H+) symporter, DAACS family
MTTTKLRSSPLLMLFALAAGAIFGMRFPSEAKHLAIVGTLFSNALRMTIYPLVFLTVTVGVYRLSDHSEKMTRMFSLTTLSICASTVVAAVIGLIAGQLVSLGSFEVAAGHASFANIEWTRFVTDMVPGNIVVAMAGNNLLPVVVFATAFGAALGATSVGASVTTQVFESISQALFKIVGWLIVVSPLPIFAIMAVFFAGHGISVGINLLSLGLTAYGALAVLFLCQCIIILLLGENPLKVARTVAEPVTLGFVTRSSEITLPLHIDKLANAGVARHLASTVLPIGYAFNKSGATLYVALVASAVAGANHVQLTGITSLALIFLSVVTVVGAVNVPSGAMVALAAILSTLNLPIEILALVVSIDALVDMPRTAMNVFGNTMIVAFVARCRGVGALGVIND